MTTAAQPPSPTSPAPRFPLRRFVKDMGYGAAFCVLTGVFITLVVGDLAPFRFYRQIVFATCIGMIAFLIIDGLRLALWKQSNWGIRQWVPFVAVVAATAPVSTYLGGVAATSILGTDAPTLADIIGGRETHNVVFTALAAFGCILLFINRERIARAEAQAAQHRAQAEAVARQAMQAQLQLLQAQIEPHMLFNTLANLQGLIAIDAARATRMLDQLIRYLRATLSSSRAEATTLAQEFDLLDAYLGLMAVRMGARLRFALHLPDELRGARVPPMLLQPLVENAIIHGLEPKIDGGELVVGAEAHGDMLELSVRDTGLGLTAAGQPGSGVGVANTRERLRGLYGQRAALALEPAAGEGTLARITLPTETV